jgi:hypothetical protein
VPGHAPAVSRVHRVTSVRPRLRCPSAVVWLSYPHPSEGAGSCLHGRPRLNPTKVGTRCRTTQPVWAGEDRSNRGQAADSNPLHGRLAHTSRSLASGDDTLMTGSIRRQPPGSAVILAAPSGLLKPSELVRGFSSVRQRPASRWSTRSASASSPLGSCDWSHRRGAEWDPQSNVAAAAQPQAARTTAKQRRERCEMESIADEARERSRSVWDAMAPGWETGRQDLWEFSRPVSEWLIERLGPRPGETILDLAAGLGETGFLAARRVGETGRVLRGPAARNRVRRHQRRLPTARWRTDGPRVRMRRRRGVPVGLHADGRSRSSLWRNVPRFAAW